MSVEQGQWVGKSQSFLQIILEPLNFYMPEKKMNLDTDFTHSTTINSKWIMDLET